jgi:hypothetical protein
MFFYDEMNAASVRRCEDTRGEVVLLSHFLWLALLKLETSSSDKPTNKAPHDGVDG